MRNDKRTRYNRITLWSTPRQHKQRSYNNTDKISNKTLQHNNKKKAQEKQEEQRQQLAEQIPTDRPYISIAEAVVLFGISRDTIYRQIRKGNIPALNLGARLTRISRIHIEAMFPKVEIAKAIQPAITKQEINFDPANCYTIGEISQKY